MIGMSAFDAELADAIDARWSEYSTGVTYSHVADDWAPAADHGPEWHATPAQTDQVAAQLRSLGYVNVTVVTR